LNSVIVAAGIGRDIVILDDPHDVLGLKASAALI
jgi:hypothetical protein